MDLSWIFVIFIIFLEYTTLVFCLTSSHVRFSNVSPPENALLRTLVGISLKQCVHECSIRGSCNSFGYKAVMNVCNLYMRSEEQEVNEYSLITVTKTDIDVETSCMCSNGEVCDMTGPMTVCIRTECPPLAINNGRSFGNGHVIGAIRIVHCDYGYYEEKNRTELYCLNSGEWSDTLTCVPVDCGELETIRNGSLVPDIPGITSYPATASVHCDTGYESDKTSLSCLGSGLWETANCNLVCPTSTGWLNVTNDLNIQIRTDSYKTYDLANEACIASRTHGLIKLNGVWKKTFVKEVLTYCRPYANRWYWVDGTAGPSNPVWRFSDGVPIIFDGPIQWNYDRPKYDTTKDNACMGLQNNVNFVDRWCKKQTWVICEM